MRAAKKVGCFILVRHVNPQFFVGALALVERSGVLPEVHFRRVRPWGEEGGPEIQLLLVEDGLVRLELLNHQAHCLIGVPNAVLVLLGEVLVVRIHNNCGNAVEVYRLFKVALVPSDPMLCRDDLLVRGGGGVHYVQVEEMRIASAAAVQCVVFRDSLHLFLVNDDCKAASLPAISTGFQARRDRLYRTDKFVDWPVLRRSCNLLEGGRFEASFDNCVDSGGTCYHHGERVVGLRHALQIILNHC